MSYREYKHSLPIIPTFFQKVTPFTPKRTKKGSFSPPFLIRQRVKRPRKIIPQNLSKSILQHLHRNVPRLVKPRLTFTSLPQMMFSSIRLAQKRQVTTIPMPITITNAQVHINAILQKLKSHIRLRVAQVQFTSLHAPSQSPRIMHPKQVQSVLPNLHHLSPPSLQVKRICPFTPILHHSNHFLF